MEPTREEIRAWLERVIRSTGLTASALARKAGVATTTLTRFLNDDKKKGVPSLKTLARIAAVAGVPAIGLDHEASRMLAAGSQEGMAISPKSRRVKAVVEALIAGRPHASTWLLSTDALAGVGYLSGDLVIVDDDRSPQVGDIVCVQHQLAADELDVLFRVYEPPYLVAAPVDAASRQKLRKPLLVDNSTVRIVGVITDLVRIADE